MATARSLRRRMERASRAVRHWASYLGDAQAGFKVLLLCDDEEQVRLLKHEIAAANDHL
ncbi:hypothetical protein AB0G04_35135 [Actinoplanes sp. NPDC023801]|uniref:hypothetical protein n=1 Tax=Actinoplanes sp. NPDC023801 TaxID=3154595 RepID=UPI0033C2C32E